ncbi:MAG: sigma-54-dependent Fis family transcriptional regulator [bacterium]|nr:sigma-54-dependent Fis family transcriptional regulator [bacterium]
MSVLVVDDEVNIRRTMRACLESRGHRVTCVGTPADARAEAGRQVFDLAFVDLRLGTDSGLDLIPALLATAPWLKVVVITAYASVDTAVEAMKRGATDYIPKPFTPAQIHLVTERVATVRGMEQRLQSLREDLARLHPEVTFASRHPGMQRAIELARQVAASEAVVLLRGPSGTGKTVLARAIHGWSRRADQPLGIVSCPTLSPELLESELFGHVKGAFTGALRDQPGRVAACEGGTLFLDEIGDLPLSLQPKLLRFLQDREYESVGDARTRKADVRVLAATNLDLATAVAEGRFREDLFYRLNVFPIELPGLAERTEDIELLATEMLAFFAAQNHRVFAGFTAEAVAALRGYAWPGNVRELRNVVERAAILCSGDVVGVEHLPDGLAHAAREPQVGDPISLQDLEDAHIRHVIATAGSLQDAADILGIDQATLWRKRKNLGL